MPIYVKNGKNYTIPDNMVDKFERANPDAIVKVSAGGTTYDLPLSKRDAFFDHYEDAAYVANEGGANGGGQRPESAPAATAQADGGVNGQQQVAPAAAARVDTAQTMGGAARVDTANYNVGNQMQAAGGRVDYNQFESGAAFAPAPSARKQEPVKHDAKVEQATREQVASLSGDVQTGIEALNDEINGKYRKLDMQAPDEYGIGKQMTSANGRVAYEQFESGASYVQDKEVYRLYDRKYALDAARAALDNSSRIIKEADKAVKEGNIEGFVKGAARGMGDGLFDVRTWDMGLHDLKDGRTLMRALDKFDKGEALTKEEEMLLEAKAVEMATNAYFGSYIGRGYKAGMVTAESIPFMLEMCINPASAVGTSAQSALTRFALKKYGKKVVKDKAKTYMTAKLATRVVGDMAGAAMMSATTGAARVAADAENRMAGEVQFGQKEDGGIYFNGTEGAVDFGTALRQAFVATTIENYSEMVGEYFSPVMDLAGKAARKGLSKIGLQGVNDMIDNVAMSDVAKLVSDFEKHSHWNGTIGEFAEEQVGGMMNAWLVGDQSMGEVWSKDNMIDTFLGVGLMGGFFSAVKTLGYRSPKRRAEKELNEARTRAERSMADQEVFDAMSKVIESGSDEDLKAFMRDVNDDRYGWTLEQRRNVMEYVAKSQAYKGAVAGEQKRRVEEASEEQLSAESAFDNGYTLEDFRDMTDTKNAVEYERGVLESILSPDDMDALEGEDPVAAAIAMSGRTGDGVMGHVLGFVNARAKYDGMIQRVHDDIEDEIAESDASVDARTHRDSGQMIGMMLKNGNVAHLIDGDAVLMDDGMTLDVRASSESFLVRDDVTGNLMFVSPHDVEKMFEPHDAERVKEANAQEIRERVGAERAQAIDGVVSFVPNEVLSVMGPDGSVQKMTVVADNGDGTVHLMQEDGQELDLRKEDVQAMVDAANMARVKEQAEPATPEEPAVQPQGTGEPLFDMGDELMLRDEDGRLVHGFVIAEMDADGMYEVMTDEPLNGRKVNRLSGNDLLDIVESKNGETVTVPEETVAAEPVAQPQGTEPVADDAMPMKGEGEDAEPDFMAVSPERAEQWIYGPESGLDAATADALVNNNITEANKAKARIEGKQPKMDTSIAKYNRDKQEWQQKKAQAEAAAKQWEDVKRVHENRMAEDARLAAERAAAEREAERLRKEAELGLRPPYTVSDEIKEKWARAKKVEGARDQITLPNGKVLTGVHMLVEADALTASHDARNGLQPTEGFPVTETGESVNTRDYNRDKDAQTFTRNVAADFDQRGMGVVASKDAGVVYSGNGRTIAGQIAADEGTDGKYIEYLNEYGQKLGYTAEQVGEFEHPRDVFVPDEELPYTPAVFDMFNKQEMKSQSKTEEAVKLGKVVDDATLGRILDTINRFEKMRDFYADNNAVNDVIKELQHVGVITQAQVAEMYDGETVSDSGKQLIENVLVGKAFENDPDALRKVAKFKSMRQSVIMALSEIARNVKLGSDYALVDELSKAIDLVYQARSEGGYKDGDRVSGYAQQTLLDFGEGDGGTVADATNMVVLMLADCINSSKTSALRTFMQSYNNNAQQSAAGQLDLFGGGRLTKDDIINQSNNAINGNRKAKDAGKPAEPAGAEGAAEAGTGDAGVPEGDGVNDQQPNTAAEGKTPEQLATEAVMTALRENGGIRVVEETQEEGQRVAREHGEGVEMMAFAKNEQEFDDMKKLAHDELGHVLPGLAEKTVNVINLSEHGFGDSFKDAVNNAKAWAKSNLSGKEFDFPGGGKYVISNKAISKYLSSSAFQKSDNSFVHLSALRVLPEIIGESIDAEIHEDYKKGEDGKRSADNGVDNEHKLVHRIYGAVVLDGKTYRVKTTMYEYRAGEFETNTPHSYEITEIELLDSPILPAEATKNTFGISNNSITGANLLKNVEKSYDNGVKLLDVQPNTAEFMQVWHGSMAVFEHFDGRFLGSGEGSHVYGAGHYVSADRETAMNYAEVAVENSVYRKYDDARIKYTRELDDFYEKYELEDGSIDWIADGAEEAWDELQKQKDYIQQLAKEKAEKDGNRKLYEVEVPEDNGKNYLSWNDAVREDDRRKIEELMFAELVRDEKSEYTAADVERFHDEMGFGDKETTVGELYEKMSRALGGDMAASDLLSRAGYTGIKVPTNNLREGDKSKWNYVVFRDGDLKIKSRVDFMLQPDGTVYGWAIGNEIHLTPEGMNPNTPIHEYAHLWAKAMQAANPKMWQRVVELMKGTPFWDEVVNDPAYSGLSGDDAIASEVLARYSGENGAKKLVEEAENVATARGLIARMRMALETFWKWVGTELFEIEKFDDATEVADRVLYDLLKKTDLNARKKEEPKSASNGIEWLSEAGDVVEQSGEKSDVPGVAAAVAAAEAETDQHPTDAQKEAGNYKKGHVKVDGYDITIENPKGSVRSGKDASGKAWSVTMNNTYGYIRGTEGVDGDHIDVFLSDDPEHGNVYVVDQVDADGNFDEHKVMYGFGSVEEARDNYLANYEEGWKMGTITEVTKEEFKKWIESSHRKTKPFSEYKSVKKVEGQNPAAQPQDTGTFTITDTSYTNKKGKKTQMKLVRFEGISKEMMRAAKSMAREMKGWYSLDEKGFMMRSEDDARKLADKVLHDEEAVADAQPVTLDEMRAATGLVPVGPDLASERDGFGEEEAVRVYGPKVSERTMTREDGATLTVTEYEAGTVMEMRRGDDRISQAYTKDGKPHGRPLFDLGVNSDMVKGMLDRHGRFAMTNEELLAAFEKNAAEDAEIKAKSIGTGIFGKIYDQFKGKVKEAFDFILANKGGDLLGVFHREGIGDIDLVWGDKGGGLEHILDKHVGEGKSFATAEEAMREIEKIINEGIADPRNNNSEKIVLLLDNKQVTIRRNVRKDGKKIADKNWILTAYDEKSADGSSAVRTKKLGQATRTTEKSRRKDSNNADNGQISGVKNAEEAYNSGETEGEGVNTADVLTPEGRVAAAKLLNKDRIDDVTNTVDEDLVISVKSRRDGFEHVCIIVSFDKKRNRWYAKPQKRITANWSDLSESEKRFTNLMPSQEEQMSIINDIVPKDLQDYFTSGQYDKDDGEILAYQNELEKKGYNIDERVRMMNQSHVGSSNVLRDKWGIYFFNEATGENNILEEQQPSTAAEDGWVSRKKDGVISVGDHVYVDGRKATVKSLSGLYGNDVVVDVDGGGYTVTQNVDANRVKYEDPGAVNSSGNGQRPSMATAEEAKPEEVKKPAKGADNKLVTADRYAELKARMKAKLNRLNAGIDPEVLAIGTEMALFHIESGARKFAAYAKAMIEDLGDAVRPYLKAFYNGARELPEVEENGWADDMTAYDEVRRFDMANFDTKDGGAMATAEMVVKEMQMEEQAASAIEEITNHRNEERKASVEIAKEGEKRSDGKKDGRKKTGEGKKSVSSRSRADIDGDLFAGLENNLTTDNNLTPENNEQLERDGGSVRTEGLPANGDNAREQAGVLGEANRQAGGGADRGGQGGGGTRLGQRVQSAERLDGQLSEDAEPGAQRTRREPAVKKNTNNNHAERGKDYAPKSVDARIEANLRAIELMQELVNEGRQATDAEKKVLRQYSGWGGLGKAFNERIGTGWNSTENPYYKQMKKLLTDEEFEQAENSRNSAYFTPAAVIDTMWDIARALGFKGGRVLEGSAGIGNIIGAMPTDMSERSDIHAVEIDGTTGNILRLLYPDAKVDVQGFEKTAIRNGSVDLAITNVPFVTGQRVKDETGDKDLAKKFHDIHDFCIAKNVRKLREGGIGIFISSRGTLDNSKKLREWLVNEGQADVIGAFRLNKETFGGTGATSDIIVIRKRVSGRKSAHAIDVLSVTTERTADFDTVEEKKVDGRKTVVPVKKTLAMEYNKYFIEHPENMGGRMLFGFEKGDTYRPGSKALYPERGKNQKEMLAEWAKGFDGMREETAKDGQQPNTAAAGDARTADTVASANEELGENVKEGSMLVDGQGRLCVAHYGVAEPLALNANKVKGRTKAECFKDYCAIKDAVADVLAYQTEHESDEGLDALLKKLNKAYDTFVQRYGHLNKNTSISFLKNDVDWPGVMALEKFDEKQDKQGVKTQTYEKTDIFNQRVVEKEKTPEPKTVTDAIQASIYLHGRVDVPYISDKLGKSEEDVRREIVESGLGYENPHTSMMEVSYEYLSGNVREKLAQAKEANTDGRYDANVKALEKVIPMDIPAHLIEFTLGSSWIEPKLYEDYVRDRTDVMVTLHNIEGTWMMREGNYAATEKNKNFGVYSSMFNSYTFGHELIRAALQNKSIDVSQTHTVNRETVTEHDKEATQACANRIDEIRADFKDWARQRMQQDSEMSERMEKVYNEQFNNFVPLEIPAEFVPKYFGGASHKFEMRPHQGRAIVRATMQPVLLAHEVGTGKTFTLISAAMEMRRLGTAKKPMIVVQNATVGQFVAAAKELYPNAKVLTLEDKDHTGEGRKNFYAKIKYNDWDMIVVPQSVFERIPDSEERQMAYIREKVQEKLAIIEQMKDAGENEWAIKQAESEVEKMGDELSELSQQLAAKRKNKKTDGKTAAKTKQNAEVKAAEMLDRQVDDVENFDDMGIDAVLVDEAHEYKHLGFATAMQRGVKGIDPSYSKKAQGVFLKTQAVLEKNNGRNVVFATGTPISNTAAEIWTFMRYLMPSDTMKEYGIYYFDDFVRNFGNLQTMLEFTTSGKFKENNRFAGYVNLPELVRIWSGVADTMLTKDAKGVKEKIPAMEGGKAQDLYLPQTKALRAVMKYVKSELDAYEHMTGKEKKENSHIPLTMYGIAKAAAVDARLVMSDAQDDPNSKTNEAVRQTLKSLRETSEYKGTVALFADNYQNKKSGFNLYEDIREKLIKEGVPAEQIVVMKSGMTVKKKLEIFKKVNAGEIRVIMGSTFTLGTGVNIQERLHTLIHLDAPNRPMDYTQRNGRILRQGNLHKEWDLPVRVLRFGVEDSLDVTAYQRLKTKGAIADSIMNGKKLMQNSMENRSMDEEEDVFGDTVAQLSGSEYAMLKNQAEKDVRKWEAKYKQWEADQTYVHNVLPKLLAMEKEDKEQAEEYDALAKKCEEGFGSDHTIHIGNQSFENIGAMGDFFTEYNKRVKEDEDAMRASFQDERKVRKTDVKVGNLTFRITTALDKEVESKNGVLKTVIHRSASLTCEELSMRLRHVDGGYFKNAVAEIIRLANDGKAQYEELAANCREDAADDRKRYDQVKERDGKPFEHQKELDEARRHLDEYTELMRKELEDKEAKYADMDADVDAANNVSEADEDSEEKSGSGDDGNRYRDGDVEPATAEDKDLRYSLREERAPKRTRTAYAVFIVKRHKDGSVSLHPKMIEGDAVGAPPLTWLNADTGAIKRDGNGDPVQNTKGRISVRDSHGSPLAWRPGKHLAPYPNASQFAVQGKTKGVKDVIPDEIVFFEVEYAADRNYQTEAWEYGVNANGKYEHSQAGLPYIPHDGYYIYRTNANPKIPAMIITGAYKIKRALTDAEAKEINQKLGGEWLERKSGKAVTEATLRDMGLDKGGLSEMASEFDYDAMESAHDESAVAMSMPGYVRRKLNFDDKNLRAAIAENEKAGGMDLDYYKYEYEKQQRQDRERGMTEFEEGQVLNVTKKDTNPGLWPAMIEYSVDGLTMPYNSFEGMLDALREKYIGYCLMPTKDRKGVVAHKWSNIIAEARSSRRRTERRGENAAPGAQRTERMTAEERTERRGAEADAEYVSRKTRNAVAFVKEKAEKLGLKVNVLTTTDGLTGRKARAKGWYDVRTGEITIVLPNHWDGADVLRTLMHEGVAHHGLRELFGKDFDTFLDNVYANATVEIRQRIAELAAKHGWDFRTATEEYMAGLAEDQRFFDMNQGEQSWWKKVKLMFVDMLRKAGIVLGDRLTDNDLRAILWKSFENMYYREEYGAMRDARREMVMQRLGVGNYAQEVADDGDWDPDGGGNGGGKNLGGRDGRREIPSAQPQGTRDESDGLLYRDGTAMDERDKVMIRDLYEQEMRRSGFQMQEAMQDSMLSVKRLMELVSKADGKEVKDYENAYMAENALSSKNHDEQQVYEHMLFRPLVDEIHRLAKDGSSREEVTRYMMAKHGLERNEKMPRFRAEREAREEFGKELRKAERAYNNDPLDSDLEAALDDVKQRMHDREEELYMKYSGRDMGGITGLMNEDDLAVAESAARQLVDDFELDHDVTELWARTNACTKATLEKTYKCGLLTKEGFESISKMYEWYIPLRGFDEKTSDEVYAYLQNEHSSFNAPIKKAEGRSSIADDPIATILNMADSAISQGNKNMVKQKFLKFAMNHANDAVSVSDLWLRRNPVTDKWEAVTADIEDGDTADEIQMKTEQFEERMEQLAEIEPENYKRGKDAVNLPYRTLGRDINEHMVHVKMNGRDYIITINGNPRAAQALNGMTNPDNDSNDAVGKILKAGSWVNRQMSAFYTTRNPEFVLSNFLRDALYANTTTWVREGAKYGRRFNRNFMKHTPAEIRRMMRKRMKGELDMTNPVERAFDEFMSNGGETGYTVVRSVAKSKKQIERYLKEKDAKIPVGTAWRLMGEYLDDWNRGVENTARFAAFLTSRQMGRTVERSVMDAKEVSVNFNKKGAGSKFIDGNGQTLMGKTAAMVSGVGRSFYVFWNASVQGTTNFGRLHKEHTAAALTLDAGVFLLGFVIAAIGNSGGDGDDEDEDVNKYYNLPPYVRRSNICFKIPGTEAFVSIPLGIEQRAIYGLGELAASLASGRERMSGAEIAKEVAASMSSLLPVDMMEGNGELSVSALAPSWAKPEVEAYITNKDWKGMPIYNDTPFNKNDPEWTKATARTNQYLVDLAETLNRWTGGDDVVRGGININPAKLEHVLEGTFGGVSTMINKMVKVGEMVAGKQDFDWRNVPMASRVMKSADAESEARRINREYHRYYDEYKETQRVASRYEKKEEYGDDAAGRKVERLYEKPEYERYEIIYDYAGDIQQLYDELKNETDREERKYLEKEILELKREAIGEIRAADDRRRNE